MLQKQSHDIRAARADQREPSAAQMFDPAAFALRLEVARTQRSEALARRNAASATDPVDQATTVAWAEPQPAAAPSSHRTGAEAAIAPQRVNPEPLVAPQRPSPTLRTSRRRIGPIAAAACFLAAALVVAVSPTMRGRVTGLADAILPTVISGAELSQPPQHAGLADGIDPPRVAVRRDASAGTVGAPVVAAEGPASSAAGTAAPRPVTAIVDRTADMPQTPPQQPAAAAGSLDLAIASPQVAAAPDTGPATATPRPPEVAPELNARTTDAELGATPVTGAPGPVAAVHAPPGVTSSELDAVLDALRSGGFASATGVRVGMTIERTHVRYFHDTDRDDARRLGGLLANADPRAEVRSFTHFAPLPPKGRLEVWLSEGAATRAAPPAAAASERPAAATTTTARRPARDPRTFAVPGAANDDRALAPAATRPNVVVGRSSASPTATRQDTQLLERLQAQAREAAEAPQPPAPAAPPGARVLQRDVGIY